MNFTRAAITISLGLATSLPIVAATDCQRLADENRLSKSAKSSFIRKCVADRAGDPLAKCERMAVQQSLRGSERNASIKRCMGDASKQI